MELHPGKGVLKKREVSKHWETLSLVGQCLVLESQKALQIAVKRREVNGKGEKERHALLNNQQITEEIKEGNQNMHRNN